MIYSWCLQISFYFNDNFNTDVKTFFVFTEVYERKVDILKKFPRGWFTISEEGQLWAVFISYPEERKGEEKETFSPSLFSHTKAAMFCDLFWARILEHWLNVYITD